MRNARLQLMAAFEILGGPQKRKGAAESPHFNSESVRELIAIGSG
jgi:hypothetical protein